MSRFFFLFLSLFCYSLVLAQSYAPNPGQLGSTAIHKDSSIILSWAENCSVQRGFLKVDEPNLGYASFGDPSLAIGQAEGDGSSVVSLGDGGVATIDVYPPLKNGLGPDFVIFENGFANDYMELAFVEVSSNGTDFYRFPSFSEVDTINQMSNASFSDCRRVHNLAGKYRAGYGTPFDLSDLDSVADLDLDFIRFIRIVDAIGTINPQYASRDALGRMINDPYPTNFESGGFDLDAVGFLHPNTSSLEEIHSAFVFYPNPVGNSLNIRFTGESVLVLYDSKGRKMLERTLVNQLVLPTHDWPSGIYFVEITHPNGRFIQKVLK